MDIPKLRKIGIHDIVKNVQNKLHLELQAFDDS